MHKAMYRVSVCLVAVSLVVFWLSFLTVSMVNAQSACANPNAPICTGTAEPKDMPWCCWSSRVECESPGNVASCSLYDNPDGLVGNYCVPSAASCASLSVPGRGGAGEYKGNGGRAFANWEAAAAEGARQCNGEGTFYVDATAGECRSVQRGTYNGITYFRSWTNRDLVSTDRDFIVNSSICQNPGWCFACVPKAPTCPLLPSPGSFRNPDDNQLYTVYETDHTCPRGMRREFVPNTQQLCVYCQPDTHTFHKCAPACDGSTVPVTGQYTDKNACLSANAGSTCTVRDCEATQGNDPRCLQQECPIPDYEKKDLVVPPRLEPGQPCPTNPTGAIVRRVEYYTRQGAERMCYNCVGLDEFWYCDRNSRRPEMVDTKFQTLPECQTALNRHNLTPPLKCYESEKDAWQDEFCKLQPLFYCDPNTKSVVTTNQFQTTTLCTTDMARRFPGRSVTCFDNRAQAAADPNCSPVDCDCPDGSTKITAANDTLGRATATARCQAIGQVLDIFGRATDCTPPNVTPSPLQYCFTCKKDCVCEDLGHFTWPWQARAARCAGNPRSCTAYSFRVTCGQVPLTCWDAKVIQRCEPQISVESRIFGYVVSDPRRVAHSDPFRGGFCGAPGGLGAELGQDVVINNGVATTGERPSTKAEFEIELVPDGGRRISNPVYVNRSQSVIAAVGSYRFNYLPWNTDTYDIVLRIQNHNQNAPELAAGQEGVWICNCPVYNADPFTCFYTSIPVPSPSNNCVGGQNNNHYGQFTTGFDDETNNSGDKLNNLIKNNRCVNPTDRNRTPNFFVTVFDVHNSPWWQARGGTVYAQDQLVSRIPTLSNVHNADAGRTSDYNRCVAPHCAPYLIAQTCNSAINSTVRNSSAYPLLGGLQAIDLRQSDRAGGASGDNTNNKTARDIGNTSGQPVHYGPREDYDYFFGLIPRDRIRNLGGNIANYTNCGDLACLVTGTLTISDDTNITVTGGGKYTIFVDGDLNIGDAFGNFGESYAANRTPRITVAPGSYLAFIVRGNINIRPQVGYINENIFYDHGNSQLLLVGESSFPKFGEESAVCDSGGYQEIGVIQGVFIADGKITVESNGKSSNPSRLASVGSKECPIGVVPDKKFVGEGTFVGWSGVDLQRDFDDRCSFTKAWNARHPTEVFNYRPDFMQNAPEWMWRSIRLRMESL